MNVDKQVYLILTVAFMSFYAGQATNAPELDNWTFLVELGTILGGFGSMGVLVIAYQAMSNWRYNQSQSIVIETAIEVEDLLTKFYLACITESNEHAKKKDLTLYSEIVLLIWRLKRRGFSVKELKEIEESLHEVIQSLDETNPIPDDITGKLLNKLNNFSKTF